MSCDEPLSPIAAAFRSREAGAPGPLPLAYSAADYEIPIDNVGDTADYEDACHSFVKLDSQLSTHAVYGTRVRGGGGGGGGGGGDPTEVVARVCLVECYYLVTNNCIGYNAARPRL